MERKKELSETVHKLHIREPCNMSGRAIPIHSNVVNDNC